MNRFTKGWRAAMLVALAAGATPRVDAEMAIPNPLIKPQPLTPLAGAEDKGRQARALPGETSALPRLPALAAPAAAAESLAPLHADNEALRTALARYEVVFVSAEQAVLKLAAHTVPGLQGLSGQAGGPDARSSAAAGIGGAGAIVRGAVGPGQITVRDRGVVKFGGEFLRVRIDGDTVELYRPRGPGAGHDEDETVFVGALAPSATAAYVPDPGRLEKQDMQYQRSLLPEARVGAAATAGTAPAGVNQ